MHPDGKGLEVFAGGVRNSVGFDWHPATGGLWLTDNGRDWRGDNLPPDELNRAPFGGLHSGFPYCYGDNITDTEFKQKGKCKHAVAPAIKLGPHVAALGMRFYTGNAFPENYRNHVFIAEHGSGNRSIPIGYQITLVRLKMTGRQVTKFLPKDGWTTVTGFGAGLWTFSSCPTERCLSRTTRRARFTG